MAGLHVVKSYHIRERSQYARELTVYHFRGHDSLSLAVFNGIVLWGATDQTGTGYRVPLVFKVIYGQAWFYASVQKSGLATRNWTTWKWRRWPALWAVTRPRSGRPRRARSPAMSKSLCRTNSSGKRSGGFITFSSSRTTVFSNDAPSANPWLWSISTSRIKPKVRAGAISRAKVSWRNVRLRLCLPMDG